MCCCTFASLAPYSLGCDQDVCFASHKRARLLGAASAYAAQWQGSPKPGVWLELCAPARRLGVTREASFEEVQDARNFLYEVRRTTCALHLCFLASPTSFEVL